MDDIITLSTDYHLGLVRSANTTPKSRERLKERIHDTVMAVVSRPGFHICVGDIYDTYTNSETVIGKSRDIVERLDKILAGNHDTVGISGRVGSLELLSEFYPDKVVLAAFGEYGFEDFEAGGMRFFMVPHVCTQALFEQSLRDAYDAAKGEEKPCVLLIHANYNNPFAEEDEASLNLSEDYARNLLGVFDYIVSGHEHIPRDEFDGRLIILGNTRPTGFGDISDKRVMVFEDGKPRFETIWRKSEGFLDCRFDEIPAETTAEFVRISGTVKASEVGEVTKKVANLWKCENVLAIKLAIEMEGAVESREEVTETRKLTDLIAEELKGTELYDLWREMCDAEAA